MCLTITISWIICGSIALFEGEWFGESEEGDSIVVGIASNGDCYGIGC